MNQRIPTKLLSAGFALLLLAAPSLGGSDGASNAANKTAVAGSTVEILTADLTNGEFSASETVLSATMKTSPPQDLIFSVTLECALWTTVETVGNDVSESTARVIVTVLFDGVEVPVADGTDGSVVFCDRTHRQTTTLFDDENATIEQFLATRAANAFNWVLADVGGGVHTIEVVAELIGEATDNAVTKAGVGARTLIVEPTHLAQGYTIGSGTGSGSQPAASRSASASSGFGVGDLWPF